jgi:hypothetical protein
LDARERWSSQAWGNTASINSDAPNPTLLAYATTKGAIQNFTAGLAQLLADKDIRANAVAPGPIWTPLIPSTMPEDAVSKFGQQVPMKRPGQPAELATAFVMLADPLSSYTSGATIAVTGGRPMLWMIEENVDDGQANEPEGNRREGQEEAGRPAASEPTAQNGYQTIPSAIRATKRAGRQQVKVTHLQAARMESFALSWPQR